MQKNDKNHFFTADSLKISNLLVQYITLNCALFIDSSEVLIEEHNFLH